MKFFQAKRYKKKPNSSYLALKSQTGNPDINSFPLLAGGGDKGVGNLQSQRLSGNFASFKNSILRYMLQKIASCDIV